MNCGLTDMTTGLSKKGIKTQIQEEIKQWKESEHLSLNKKLLTLNKYTYVTHT